MGIQYFDRGGRRGIHYSKWAKQNISSFSGFQILYASEEAYLRGCQLEENGNKADQCVNGKNVKNKCWVHRNPTFGT